jgi:hypothetical protein
MWTQPLTTVTDYHSVWVMILQTHTDAHIQVSQDNVSSFVWSSSLADLKLISVLWGLRYSSHVLTCSVQVCSMSDGNKRNSRLRNFDFGKILEARHEVLFPSTNQKSASLKDTPYFYTIQDINLFTVTFCSSKPLLLTQLLLKILQIYVFLFYVTDLQTTFVV